MPQKQRLGTGIKVVYATGAAIDGITNSVLPTFLFFYLTAVCGLGATLAGFAVSCSLVIDAVADPFIGSMSDNHLSRWGRRHPFMLASALPMAITLGMLFSIPIGLSKWVLFTYVVLTLLALRLAVSAWVLPYQALGAELAEDYDERSTIVAYRVFFAMPGVAICLSLGFLVFLRGPNGLLNRAAYVPFGWACGFFILLSALTATFGTRRLIGRLHQPTKPARGSVSRFVREVRELLHHRSFLILSGAATLFFIALTASMTLGLHAGKFFWKLPNGVLQAMSLSLFIAPILGILLVAACARRFEKRSFAVAGIGYIGASLLVLPILKIVGVLPESGMGLYVPLVANSVLTGMFVGSSTIVYQSMFVDAADEHQVLFGARREGLFYAGLSLAVKCGAGLGALLAGVALDLIAFPSDIANRGIESLVIPPKTISALGLVYGPAPALIMMLAAALLLGYRVNRAEYARIRVELDRRAEVAAEVSRTTLSAL
jgi:glycoside/pentoside/hexuronide:cation symporter, GPH family